MFSNTIQIKILKYPIQTLSKSNIAVVLIKIIFTFKSILYYYANLKLKNILILTKTYIENVLTCHLIS